MSRIASIEIDGRSIEVSRPDKVLSPDAGITKADLAGCSVVRRLDPKADPWRDIEMARGSVTNARRALDRILESQVD